MKDLSYLHCQSGPKLPNSYGIKRLSNPPHPFLNQLSTSSPPSISISNPSQLTSQDFSKNSGLVCRYWRVTVCHTGQIIFKKRGRMDKSMVQELTAMAQSSIFKPRQSVISTQYSDLEGSSMRKSRILNYPGYKREDLSGRLNFVVVFQTIEIERLSWEIEKQRVTILDLQRQHANCYNYEVQIRELTERIHQSECEREGFNERCAEKDQLCERIFMEYEAYKAAYGEEGSRGRYQAERERGEKLEKEAEMWRGRCTAMAKEMEAAKREMSSRESRTLKELTSKHEQESSVLRGESERMKIELSRRTQQLEEMEHIIGLLHSRDSEIVNINQQMEEYENKCAMISQENYRLNELLRGRETEMGRYRESEAKIRGQLQEASKEREESLHWRREIELKTCEIADLKKQLSKTNEYISEAKQSNLRMSDLQKQNKQFSAQIISLSQELRVRSAESQEYCNRVTMLQTKISSMNNATQREFAAYEEKIMGYGREEERLKGHLQSRVEENRRLMQRAGDVEQVCLRIKTVEEENQGLRQQLVVCGKTIEEFSQKIRRSEESLALLEDLEMKIKQEENKRKEIIAAKDKQEETMRQLADQLQAALLKNNSLQSQVTKFTSIQSELSACHTAISSMSQQLTRITSQLQLRSSQLSQLKQSLRSLSNRAQSSNLEQMLNENIKQMEVMVLKQDDLRKENEKLQNDVMILEFTNRKIENQNALMFKEKEEMEIQLRGRVQETKEMQQQLAELASKVTELREMQLKLAETQKQLQGLRTNYDKMESRYISECKKSNEFSMQVEQLSTQLIELRSAPRLNEQLSTQITFIRTQSQQKDQIIIDLRMRIERIENILRILRQKYELTATFATTLQRSVHSCSTKMDFFEDLVAALQKYSEPHAQSYEIERVQMCESMRVLQEVNPVPNVDVSYKQDCKAKPQQVHERLGQFQRFESQTALMDRFDRIEEREGSEGNDALFDRRDESSMSGSLINTLITKESLARFDNSRAQYEPQQPSFGRNTSASNLRYIPLSQSPSSARFGNVMIDTQMETSNVRLLPSPSNISSPIHESGFSGLPRVTSHTVLGAMRINPSSEYLVGETRDVPHIRVIQPLSSPSRNTASYTRTISRTGQPSLIKGEIVRIIGP